MNHDFKEFIGLTVEGENESFINYFFSYISTKINNLSQLTFLNLQVNKAQIAQKRNQRIG